MTPRNGRPKINLPLVVSVTAAAIIFFLLDLLKDLLREDMVVVVREGSREISVLIGIKVDI